MSIAVRAHNLTHQTTGGTYTSGSFACVAGDGICVAALGLSLSFSTAPTCTDSAGNTYTAQAHSTANMAGWLFKATAGTTSLGNVVTVSTGGGSMNGPLCVVSVSGTSGIRDIPAAVNTFGSNATVTTDGSPVVGDLMLTFAASNQTGTITYTSTPTTTSLDSDATSGANGVSASYSIATAGANSMKWTISGSDKLCVFAAVFAPASGGTSVALTGSAATSAAGTLTSSGGSLSVALTGQGIASADGNVALPVTLYVGSHTMIKVGEGLGATPQTSAAIDTQTGSAFFAFVGGYTSNVAVPTDNMGNTYSSAFVGPGEYVPGYSGAFVDTPYLCLNGTGGTGHTISVTKTADATGEITLPFIELRGVNYVQDYAYNDAASSGTITSGNVTTTGPAILLAFWWGAAGVKDMTAVPSSGWSIVDSFLNLPDSSGVQCAVASQIVSGAGTYNVTWTDSPAQEALLWIYAFQYSDAPSLVNSTSAASGGSTTALTTTAIDTTGADGLVVVTDYASATAVTLTDNKGNTFVQVGTTAVNSGPTVGGTLEGNLWKCVGATCGSGHTFTVTTSPSHVSFLEIYVAAVANMEDIDVSGIDNTGTASASSITGSAITPTKAALMLAFGLTSLDSDVTWTPGNGYALATAQTNAANYTGFLASKTLESPAADAYTTALSPTQDVDYILYTVAVKSAAAPALVLTGASVTSAAGTLTPSSDGGVALTGSAATSAAGAIGAAAAIAMAGIAAIAAAGVTVPNISIALTGQAITAAQGTVTASEGAVVALTGQAATSAAGTLMPATLRALSGQSATSAQGSVTVSGGQTVALTGQSVASAAGTLKPSAARALAGQAAASAAGTLVGSRSKAITGTALTSAAGSVKVARTTALVGQGLVSATGTVTPPQVIKIALNGQSLSVAQGTVSAPIPPFAPRLQTTKSRSTTIQQLVAGIDPSWNEEIVVYNFQGRKFVEPQDDPYQ